MAKVYFKVLTKVTDPDKEVSIRIRLKHKRIDQATSTGETVKLKYWDLPTQKFNRKNFKGKDTIVSKLKKLEIHILEQFSPSKEIKKGWLVDIVDRYNFPNKYKHDSANEKMLVWIENWIEKSNKEYRTIRKYYSTLNSLKDFNSQLEWKDVTLEFYDDFIAYLEKEKYAKNTIADRIKVLKVFCNAAYERKIHDNIDFKSSAFKKQTEETLNIYLNEEELSQIFKLDLSQQPHLDRVRDIFIIGCWTGCRFSDLNKITTENIDGNFLKIEQHKTKKRVIIPLHPAVKKILNKYNWNLPEPISNQKFNVYIKEVAELAEINGKVSKSITKGGERQTEIIDKHQMVSSHTARRSFATNLYKSGFPSISIMAMTGHTTEKSFLTYIKVSEEEHAELLIQHWNKTYNLNN